jgi:CDP-diacylglycerol--glycerol-3-phosphate 3-phosphatidyltransferase
MPAALLIIMILRDTIVDAVRFLAASNNVVIAASIWGKSKTMTQMIAICLMLLNNPIFSVYHIPVDLILMYLATAFSVFSGIDYLRGSKDFIMESM